MFKKLICTLVLSAVFAVPAFAGDTHSFIKPDLNAQNAPVAVKVEKPTESKPFDRSFKFALAYDFAGILADHGTTAVALGRCKSCIEGNTLFRRKNGQPNYVANAIVSGVPIVVAILLEKKGHRKAARVLLYIAGSIRFGAAIHNLRIN